MFATGSHLIDDIKKAPDEVLSRSQLLSEVRLHAKRRVYAHGGHEDPSIRIHNGLTEPERRLLLGSNPFQIHPGYRK